MIQSPDYSHVQLRALQALQILVSLCICKFSTETPIRQSSGEKPFLLLLPNLPCILFLSCSGFFCQKWDWLSPVSLHTTCNFSRPLLSFLNWGVVGFFYNWRITVYLFFYFPFLLILVVFCKMFLKPFVVCQTRWSFLICFPNDGVWVK